MNNRPELVQQMSFDIARALHGLDQMYQPTGDEAITAVLCAVLGFVYPRSRDEEHYRELIKSCAGALVSSLDNPRVQRVQIYPEIRQ